MKPSAEHPFGPMQSEPDIGLLNLINWRRAQATSLHAERVGETEWRALEELVLSVEAEGKANEAWRRLCDEIPGIADTTFVYDKWQRSIGRKNRAMKAIREWGGEAQHQDPSPK